MKKLLKGLSMSVIAFALVIGMSPVLALAAPVATSVAPNFGATTGGTAFTITGTGFGDATATVTVGGVTATSIVVVNATTITAVTPAHAAGLANVVVTNPTTGPGTSTLVGGFTYLISSSPSAVNLGTAGDFAILSKTGITTTGVTAITGDLGISPAAASDVTGFGLALDATGTFATSSLVTGRIYASDQSGGGGVTSSMLTTAVSDMETAYTAALVPATTVLNAGSGNLGGMTLPAGVYTFNTGVTIPTALTLNGSSSDVWIFQISGNLSIASATSVLLTGGATANHVFWAVAGTTTLGSTSAMKGTILAGPATSGIAFQNGATLSGKALGQKEVTLIGNTIVDSTTNTPRVLTPGVTGIVAPVRNGSPVNLGTLTPDAATYTVTSVTWSPVAATFGAGKVYTATVVLTSLAGYKFPAGGVPVPTVHTGGTVSAGVTGGGNVSGNTLTYTITFPATNRPSSSGGGGSVVVHPPVVTPTDNPNTPVLCSPGQMFNGSTGERCTSSTGLVFCPPGQMFNGSTGERCNSVANSTAPGASGYAFGQSVVKMGSKGEECKAWQMFLNDKKNAGLVLDGNCGPKTIASAKAWQMSAGLKVDGMLGAMSRAKAEMQ
jgi:hypothetical protein